MQGRQVGQSGACSFEWRTKMSARAHALVAYADGTTEFMSSPNRHRLVHRVMATQHMWRGRSGCGMLQRRLTGAQGFLRSSAGWHQRAENSTRLSRHVMNKTR
jgi:hypothetical protein